MKDGMLLIDKPTGMSSFGVVARVRRVLSRPGEGKGAARAADSLRAWRDEGKPSVVPHKRKRVKVGHTGTLDPFASGLMILLVGGECKNAEKYSKLDKSYEATVRLGQNSSTGDPEGKISHISDARPKLEVIEGIIKGFVGEIEQVPPKFSAIKIGGQRAYKLAREGKEIEVPKRKVKIYSIDILDYSYPNLKIMANVSSGTYIRTLAEDIGRKLAVGAYCSELRRVSVGRFHVDDAKLLEDFGVVD